MKHPNGAVKDPVSVSKAMLYDCHSAALCTPIKFLSESW